MYELRKKTRAINCKSDRINLSISDIDRERLEGEVRPTAEARVRGTSVPPLLSLGRQALRTQRM